MSEIHFTSLPSEESVSLELPFLVSEIKDVVWDCEGSKSPGPNDYKLNFIKRCWSFFEQDFVRMFTDFHENGRLSKVITSSFLTLIPKRDNPLKLGDYRSFFLVGCIYKVLAKLLTSRLKRVLDSIVSNN